MPGPSLSEVATAYPPGDEADADLSPVEDIGPFSYVPNEPQRAFHELQHPRKLMLGGLGMGKSHGSSYEGFLHTCVYNRNTPHIHLAGAPTYRMLKDVKLPLYRALFNPDDWVGGSFDAAYNHDARAARLASGTLIIFRSLGDQAFHRVRGIELTSFDIDELRILKNAEAWETVEGRLRGPGNVRRGWGSTTPNGHDWVAEKWVVNPTAPYAYVHGTSYDNPTLTPDYLEFLKQSYSEAYFRQEVLGEIVSFAGAVYNVSRELFPHGNVIELPDTRNQEAYLAVDFGRRNPRALVIQPLVFQRPGTPAGQRDEVRAEVIVDEWQEADGSPPADHLIDDMIGWARGCGWRLAGIYGDPAGDARNDQTHETSAKKLAGALGLKFHSPRGDERIKNRGEELVAGMVCAADGTRRLLWAGAGRDHPLGGRYVKAENSMKAMQRLQYAEHRPGRPAPNESLKDGVNDHDPDAIRYYMVPRYSRQVLNLRSLAPMAVAV